MMEPDHYTTSTSTYHGADDPTSIKEEPDEDDDPQTVLFSNQSDIQLPYQQHLADHNYCDIEDCKTDIPIINITPIVTNGDCSTKPEEEHLTVNSEFGDNCNSSATSIQTAVKCEVVPNVTPNLYEVKNEFSCITQTEIVHKNRLDVGSELVEVPGELDCKPELVGNVNNFVVLGDFNIHTSVQHNDTVNQEPPTSMETCDIDIKEETAVGPRISHPMISPDVNSHPMISPDGDSHPMISPDGDDSTDLDVDETPSPRGSDVQPVNYSHVNNQLSTQDDVMMNVHENTAYTNKDDNSVLCDKELCEGTIKPFSCTRCEKNFTSKEEFTSHCATHKTAAIYKCNVCDKTFILNDTLTKHLITHTGEIPIQCVVCDKRFVDKISFITHLEIHIHERSFQCTVCDKHFANNSTLKRHLRVHSDEHPFQCTVCNKRFTQKRYLTRHLRVHSDECAFQCTVCDKRFTHQSVLTNHLRVHSGEHLFHCTVCNKRFTQKRYLTSHLRVHSGECPFQCTVCDKRFTQQQYLTVHLRVHSGERPS